MPDAPPTSDELKKALPHLFALAAQCSAYHNAFSLFYPREAMNGIEVNHAPPMQQIFNAVCEATLMSIRKTAEFFKPATDSDRADTLHSYQFPAYTSQTWIVPRETYVQFHKRVGHLTLEEIREGKVQWPIFELAMQALNQWSHFFGAMAIEYAGDETTANYCAKCAEVISGHAAKLEREARRSLQNSAKETRSEGEQTGSGGFL
ncbi:MAG TPA: hypothetical protein VG734_17915 [Lacunisphaera sp.]|nr:hypothetical protein [Lacunisphaera sp.]